MLEIFTNTLEKKSAEKLKHSGVKHIVYDPMQTGIAFGKILLTHLEQDEAGLIA